jgi:hypothetical protein
MIKIKSAPTEVMRTEKRKTPIVAKQNLSHIVKEDAEKGVCIFTVIKIHPLTRNVTMKFCLARSVYHILSTL